MLLNDLTKDDAQFGFINSDEFAELCIYHPPSPASARNIYAVVDRNPHMTIEPGASLVPFMQVLVANSNTDGISSNEMDRGLDMIEIKRRLGDSNFTSFKIREISKQDAGMLLLKVE